ncbi:MAG: rhomboid family intramembrane serine protease [Candidatus Woesearchaeota archaeon]
MQKSSKKYDFTENDFNEEIESEVKFIWKLFKQLLAFPFILFLFLIKKRKFSDVVKPLVTIKKFIFAAKFTIQIILLNCIIFISQLFMSDEFFSILVSYPSDLFSIRIFSLITSGFLHANLSHLLWNMLGIFIFGRVIERKLRYKKTALIYFGALIISGIFSSILNLFLFDSNIGGIGASGALMGLIGTAMLLDPMYLTHDLLIPLPVMIVSWVFIIADVQGVLSGINDGIGHLAHIGGFISISLLYFFLDKKYRWKLRSGLWVNIISALIAGVFYILLVVL